MSANGPLTDPQLQDRLRGVQKTRARQLDDDLRALMRQEWGRRLAYWLIFDVGRLQAVGFDAGIKDGVCASLHHMRFEGRRDAAVDLHNQLQSLVPDMLLAMMAEQIQATKADLALEIENESAEERQ